MAIEIIHHWKLPIPARENPFVQCKIQKITLRISFVTKIRILVCVEILYEALNMMHLNMKSLTNFQVLGIISSVYKTFHDQMHIAKSYI